MPVVVVVHITDTCEYSGSEDAPDWYAQFGLESEHDIVAKHIAMDASQAVLSAQAWKHGVEGEVRDVVF